MLKLDKQAMRNYLFIILTYNSAITSQGKIRNILSTGSSCSEALLYATWFRTTMVFLHADGESTQVPLPSLVSCTIWWLCATRQNTDFCIPKVADQA